MPRKHHIPKLHGRTAVVLPVEDLDCCTQTVLDNLNDLERPNADAHRLAGRAPGRAWQISQYGPLRLKAAEQALKAAEARLADEVREAEQAADEAVAAVDAQLKQKRDDVAELERRVRDLEVAGKAAYAGLALESHTLEAVQAAADQRVSDLATLAGEWGTTAPAPTDRSLMDRFVASMVALLMLPTTGTLVGVAIGISTGLLRLSELKASPAKALPFALIGLVFVHVVGRLGQLLMRELTLRGEPGTRRPAARLHGALVVLYCLALVAAMAGELVLEANALCALDVERRQLAARMGLEATAALPFALALVMASVLSMPVVLYKAGQALDTGPRREAWLRSLRHRQVQELLTSRPVRELLQAVMCERDLLAAKQTVLQEIKDLAEERRLASLIHVREETWAAVQEAKDRLLTISAEIDREVVSLLAQFEPGTRLPAVRRLGRSVKGVRRAISLLGQIGRRRDEVATDTNVASLRSAAR